MKPDSIDSKYRLDTLQTALRLIDLLLESPEPKLGVSEISRRLRLAKSQTYRILQNLAEYGYIRQDLETREYQLGLKFLTAGQAVSERLDLLRIANPYLDELCDRTGETVHLVLAGDHGPVCVAERQSYHRLRFFASVGMHLPWHAGSASKVLLAYLPPEKQEKILSSCSFEAYTPNTITRADSLRKELRKILCDGYATSDAEMNVGARAVAAPIRNYTGAGVATISVVGLAERLDARNMAELVPQVVQAARNISLGLGFSEQVSTPVPIHKEAPSENS